MTTYTEKNSGNDCRTQEFKAGFGYLGVITLNDLVGKIELRYNIETSHLFPPSKGDYPDMVSVPTRLCSQNFSFASHKMFVSIPN